MIPFILADAEPSPVAEALNAVLAPVMHACADASPLTLWASLAVVVAIVLVALKQGVKAKPSAPNAPVMSPGKWGWVAVAVLWVVVMLNYFDRQLLAVLNSSITEGEGGISMTQAQFGTVTSAFLIVYAALSPVGGYMADRFSRKFIILCSLVVWSVVTWMTGKAESYEELIFWRGAMGISEAFYIPAALALITDYHRGSTRSLATGIHMSGIYAGQMLAGCGAILASDQPYALGWRLTFESFGFIGVAYALVVIFLLHDPKPAAAAEATEAAEEAKTEEKPAEKAPEFGIGDVLKSFFSSRAFPLLLVMYCFAGFANWFLMGWYPRLLQDMFGVSEGEAGPMATFWINMAKYVAVLAAAAVADFWFLRTQNPNSRAYVPGICFMLAGPCVIVAMALGMTDPAILGLGVTVALVSMQGVAQGSLDATLMPVLRSHIDERFAATGYGMLNLTSVGAGALISWLGGMLKDMNIELGVPLCLAGVLMVLCGLTFFLLPRKKA